MKWNIPDYSRVENFGLACIEAIADNYKQCEVEFEKYTDNNSGLGIVEVLFSYKGDIKKVKAELSLDFGDIQSVEVISANTIK